MTLDGLCLSCLLRGGMASADGDSMPFLDSLDRFATDGERYETLGELGRGGMGRILLVRDGKFGREVALKELPLLPLDAVTPEVDAAYARARERFLREACITGLLEHPAIVPVHDVGRHADGRPYYTMRLIRGRSLAMALDAADTLEARLALLPHYLDACQAVAYAHRQGVVHRDVKPANIMVGDLGETVVIDWGLARWTGNGGEHGAAAPWEAAGTSVTRAGDVVGTPQYMAPEQASGDPGGVTERSDVYALGVILYEILTGRLPFEGRSDRTVLAMLPRQEAAAPLEPAAGMPRELAAICARAMDPDPGRRYANAADLAEEIQRFQAGTLVEAYEYRFADHLRRFVRRQRVPLGLGAAAAVLVLCLAIASYTGVARERNLAVDAQGRAELREYYATIALAHDRLRQGQFADVPALLAACPEQLRAWEWGYLSAACPTEDRRIDTVFGGYYAMALSPDEGRIATTGYDSSLACWDAATGHKLWEHQLDEAPEGLGFSHDGTRLFAVRQDLLVYDGDGALLRKSVAGGYTVHALCAHPAGDLVYMGTVEEGLRVYHVAEDTVRVAPTESAPIWCLDISRDGRTLVWGDQVGGVYAFDTATETVRWSGHGSGKRVNAIALSPGARLVAAGDFGRLGVWSAEDGSPVFYTELSKQEIKAVAFHPGGARVIAASMDGNAYVVDAATGDIVEALQTAGPLLDIGYADDGEHVITGGWDGAVRWWRLDGMRPYRNEAAMEAPPIHTGTRVALSPDGQWAAANGFEGGHIALWRTRDWALDRVVEVPGAHPRLLDFVRDTGELALAVDRELRRYSVPDMTLTGTATFEKDVNGFAFSASGRRVALSIGLHKLGVWDFDRGAFLPIEDPFTEGYMRAVALSPDGALFIAGSNNWPEIAIYHLPDPTPIFINGAHTKGIETIALHPTEPLFATASRDGTIGLWNTETGAHLRRITGHAATVSAATFTPDGRRLITGSFDHSVRVWDWQTAHELLYLPNTTYYALSATLTPDGQTLLTTDSEPIVHRRTCSNR